MPNQPPATTTSEPIQALWIGERLTTMERLSIISFLKNGHPYHLYRYDDIQGVPEGVVHKDAAEILPRERIFRQQAYDTVAAFASMFRYKLLLDRGGYWADCDVVCLRPFNWKSQYVFASERRQEGTVEVTNGVMKVPAGSEIMRYCFDAAQQKANPAVRWGEMRSILNKAVQDFALTKYVVPPSVFNPVDYFQWKRIVTEDVDDRVASELLKPNSSGTGRLFQDWSRIFRRSAAPYAVHLWHEMWRREGLDPNGQFPPGCLYEQLKRKYL